MYALFQQLVYAYAQNSLVSYLCVYLSVICVSLLFIFVRFYT